MKWLLLTLLTLLLCSCSDQPVAMPGVLLKHDKGWITGDDWVKDGTINTTDNFSVQLTGTNITDYYRTYLNFGTSDVDLSITAHADANSVGKVVVRLYTWDDSMLHDSKEIVLNGSLQYNKTLHLDYIPLKAEVEFINFTGAVVFALRPSNDF